jgi:hypothetical protein
MMAETDSGDPSTWSDSQRTLSGLIRSVKRDGGYAASGQYLVQERETGDLVVYRAEEVIQE